MRGLSKVQGRSIDLSGRVGPSLDAPLTRKQGPCEPSSQGKEGREWTAPPAEDTHLHFTGRLGDLPRRKIEHASQALKGKENSHASPLVRIVQLAARVEISTIVSVLPSPFCQNAIIPSSLQT